LQGWFTTASFPVQFSAGSPLFEQFSGGGRIHDRPVSVLTFDTFQQRREGQGEKLKMGKQKAEMGRGTADH
jgi:hypothetical protein